MAVKNVKAPKTSGAIKAVKSKSAATKTVKPKAVAAKAGKPKPVVAKAVKSKGVAAPVKVPKAAVLPKKKVVAHLSSPVSTKKTTKPAVPPHAAAVKQAKKTIAPEVKAKKAAKPEKKAIMLAPSDIRETGSTISTGSGAAAATSSVLRDHAGIARGIAERKAAAKAKNIARLARPAIERSRNLKKLTMTQSKEYEAMLLRLRDKTTRQIAYLRGASLTRSDEVNVEEDGSDAFERQLALKLASNEGDAIFEIDEALLRIKEGDYGVCQDCSCVISPARLKALPFARRCVGCKAVAEKNRDVNDRRYF